MTWQISGGFRIDAYSEHEAQRALDAIERAARRASANVTIHVHVSEGDAAMSEKQA